MDRCTTSGRVEIRDERSILIEMWPELLSDGAIRIVGLAVKYCGKVHKVPQGF